MSGRNGSRSPSSSGSTQLMASSTATRPHRYNRSYGVSSRVLLPLLPVVAALPLLPPRLRPLLALAALLPSSGSWGSQAAAMMLKVTNSSTCQGGGGGRGALSCSVDKRKLGCPKARCWANHHKMSTVCWRRRKAKGRYPRRASRLHLDRVLFRLKQQGEQ